MTPYTSEDIKKIINAVRNKDFGNVCLQPSNLSRQPSEPVNKDFKQIYAMSDLHADYSTFYKRLIDFGIISPPLQKKEIFSTFRNKPDIYDFTKLVDFGWIPENTLLVICGDIIDGRRVTKRTIKIINKFERSINYKTDEVDDVDGSFELYLHIFLKNLKAKALARNSDVICILGNHDIMLFGDDSKFNEDYVHTTSNSFFSDKTGKNFRKLLLAPFYLSNFYFIFSLGTTNRTFKFVHASLHSGNKKQNKNIEKETILLQETFFENIKKLFLSENDEEVKKFNDYVAEAKFDEIPLLWQRDYGKLMWNDEKCDSLFNEKDTTIIVGHCQCTEHPYFLDRPCRINNSCVFSKCHEEESSGSAPRLVMVDTIMSNCFRGPNGMNESIEILKISCTNGNVFDKYETVFYDSKSKNLTFYDLNKTYDGDKFKTEKKIIEIDKLNDDHFENIISEDVELLNVDETKSIMINLILPDGTRMKASNIQEICEKYYKLEYIPDDPKNPFLDRSLTNFVKIKMDVIEPILEKNVVDLGDTKNINENEALIRPTTSNIIPGGKLKYKAAKVTKSITSRRKSKTIRKKLEAKRAYKRNPIIKYK